MSAARKTSGLQASRLQEALVLALGLGALLASSAALEARGLVWPLAALLAFAGESWGPGATRSTRDALRRAGAFLFLGTGALVGASRPDESGLELPNLFALAAFVGATHALALALGRKPAPALEASRGTRRLVRALFLLAVAANGLTLTLGQLAFPERHLDLRALPLRHLEGHDTLAELSHATPFLAGDDAVLSEDGAPLAHPGATHADVAALGSGRYAITAGRLVHFSSSDGSDPLANGRAYELAYAPEVVRSLPARALFGLACGLGFVAWCLGALPLGAASTRRTRIALALVLVAAFASGLPRRWGSIGVVPDSPSYTHHEPTRPALYPAFVDLFDQRPEAPRGPLSRTEVGRPLTQEQLRFVGVVRAQKVLSVAALAVLFWVLSGSVSAWVLAALVQAATLADLSAWADESLAHNAGVLQSEGLNQPLVFLWLAAAFAALVRPSWRREAALALVTSLLVLDRPSGLALAFVFAPLWLGHATLVGWRRASLRTALLVLLFALPLVLASAERAREYGYFRLHSFTGQNVFGVAFQTAEPGDEDAFEEPELRALVKACLADGLAKRVPTSNCEYVNVNAFEIGIPAFDRAVQVPSGVSFAYYQDDVLAKVGKRLIARHPRAFLGVVLSNMKQALAWRTHGALVLAALIALALYRRRRSGELLFAAFFAIAPLVAILPSCVLNFPLPRYRSQLEPAELCAIPLLVTLIATLGSWRLARGTTSPAA